jgi:hypothetical protein
MKTKSLKMLLACFLLLSGFTIQSAFAGLQEVKKENRNVGVFSSINFAISGDLYLSQGDKNEVVIEADSDILEKITTEVKGNTLTIEFDKWYNYRGNGKINVYITTKNIEKIMLTGSGNIINKTAINSPDLVLVVTGSGKILFDNLTTQNIESTISGSGDIKLKSSTKAKSVEAVITGSGDIDMSMISFETGDLSITGSGSITANVVDKLEALITGSGKITYIGKPLIDASITGSGKIVNGN